MLNKSVTSFLSACLILAPLFSVAQTQYVVRKGDTLLKIADKTLGKKNDPRRYELVSKIKALNPNLKNPNALEPGLAITLPSDGKTEVTEKPAPPIEVKSAKEEKAVELAPPTHPPVTLAEPATPVPPQAPPPPIPPVAPEAPKTETTATPPAVEKPVASAPEKHAPHKHFVMLQPRLHTLQIDTKEIATGTKAKMKSDSSVGIDLQYGYVLNDRVHLLLQAGVTQTEFSDIQGDGTSVNHKSESLKSFAVGVGFEATHTLHLDLMLMSADRTFLLPDVLPAYKLEAVTLPGAEFNISWDAYTAATNIFGISAIAEYIAEAKKDEIEYKSTLDPIVALYWKSNRGHDRMNYKITLAYKHGHQDTSLTEQKEDVTTFAVGVYF